MKFGKRTGKSGYRLTKHNQIEQIQDKYQINHEGHRNFQWKIPPNLCKGRSSKIIFNMFVKNFVMTAMKKYARLMRYTCFRSLESLPE